MSFCECQVIFSQDMIKSKKCWTKIWKLTVNGFSDVLEPDQYLTAENSKVKTTTELISRAIQWEKFGVTRALIHYHASDLFCQLFEILSRRQSIPEHASVFNIIKRANYFILWITVAPFIAHSGLASTNWITNREKIHTQSANQLPNIS